MNAPKRAINPKLRAEASAWIARLHGPRRDSNTEAGFRAWLSADAAHASAFEQVTEAWEAVATVPSERLSSMVRWERVGKRSQWARPVSLALAAGVAAAAIGLGALWWNAPLTTGIGERRAVTLEDGSQVYLNTASRLRIHYDRRMRRVELVNGEAFFDVKQRPNWPFVVDTGDHRIRALGTSFVVRKEGEHLAVTVLDGRVAVDQAPVIGVQEADHPILHAEQELVRGQRLTETSDQPPILDHPTLDRIVAWQRGLVILDNTPLKDAIAEMNRYSALTLVVKQPDTAALRISGAFRAGDSLSFARAIATTYRLEVETTDRRIALNGFPRPTYQ